MEQDIFFYPEHEKVTGEGGDGDSRHHGGVEAGKVEKVDVVDIAQADLVLFVLQVSVQLTLPQLHPFI